jgi:CheY-like chemotaxis protein
MLTQSGYKVVCAPDNAQSLAMIRQHKPDVLILDLTRPDCENWELFHEIKADKNLAGIPIIDISPRIGQGGRIIIADQLSPSLDFERVVRSIKILARKCPATTSSCPV